MTRDTRAHADRLSEVLDAARGALVAEGARALEAAREAEIAQALTPARVHPAGLTRLLEALC